MPAPSILLVQGAGRGAWCWEPILASLATRAIPAVAIDLPRHGARRKASWLVSWKQYIYAVRQAVAAFDTSPIVVGHSMGGGAITGAVELVPALFDTLVYLTAFVPQDRENIAGQAKTDDAAPPVKTRFSWGEVCFDPDEAAAHFFHDCPQPDHWARLIQLQPIRPAGTAIRSTAGRFGTIRRHYIRRDRDCALSPAFQLRMIARTTMQRVFHMDCGHSPFIADPDELADNLAGIRNVISTGRSAA